MATAQGVLRKLPVGAELTEGGANFRVWAPERKMVRVAFVDTDGNQTRCHALDPQPDGFFAGELTDVAPGALYYYRLDDEATNYPDPASRFQPRGVHGPSEVITAEQFAWQDGQWPGVALPGQVLYELHIGTFTPEGTWLAAIDKLPHLRELGVTSIEVMPLSAFSGNFGWGYDGVCWFAPTQLYGRPDDFRTFVDHAHRLGLGVILDVVYNHFGPDGNYTGAFSPHYISRKHHTEWGDAINFDGEHSEPVRDFVAANAAYWICEFHLDGLRLDAVHSIVDDSDEHIVTMLTRAARAAAGNRSVLIFGENERQQAHQLLPPEEGGYGIDGLWNDDFHHAARLAATGSGDGYYRDYSGSPQELVSAIRLGYLYQGQWDTRQAKYRGTSSRGISGPQFVHFLQNHDQVANSATGLRTHMLTTAGRHRALTALLLLGPQTPMLFMGQEFAASNPFRYFADHGPELAALVEMGRLEFMSQFPQVKSLVATTGLPSPSDPATFANCKINWQQRDDHSHAMALHRDLLRLRREDTVFSRQDRSCIEGSIVGPEAFVLHWFDEEGDDRLALVNLGRLIHALPTAEPLVAPPAGCRWQVLWSSEEPQYGGSGTPGFDEKNWHAPGHAAFIFRAAQPK